jgi:membrane associated rhomboid family serine protease
MPLSFLSRAPAKELMATGEPANHAMIHWRWVSWALCLMCAAISVSYWVGAPSMERIARQWYGLTRTDVFSATFWIYWAPSVLLHSGWPHLLGNIVALLAFGLALEGEWGHLRFGLHAIIVGVVSSASQALWAGAGDIGISGVVYGCVGAVVAGQLLRRQFHTPLPRVAVPVLLLWLVIGVVFGHVGGRPIGNAAHISGLAAGFLLGLKGGVRARNGA